MKKDNTKKEYKKTDEELQLEELLVKVMGELESIKIPISKRIAGITVNNRTKKRLGACRRVNTPVGRSQYNIEISHRALTCEEKDLCSIIAHELLHTCPGCFNHGKKWKYYGNQVQSQLGYSTKRTVAYEALGIAVGDEEEQIKYSVCCPSCGQAYARRRMCPLIKNPENYRCGKCGSSLANATKNTISCR